MSKKKIQRDEQYASRIKQERLKRNLAVRPKGEKKRLVDVTPKRFASVPQGLKTPPFDCVYRGSRLNIKACRGCGKPEKVAIFQCTIHGRCSYNIQTDDGAGVKVCTACLD